MLILTYIGIKGISVFSADFFLHSMNGVTSRMAGGGLYHALIGTLEQVAIAAVIALPIGIFTAIYLVEYGRGTFARDRDLLRRRDDRCAVDRRRPVRLHLPAARASACGRSARPARSLWRS